MTKPGYRQGPYHPHGAAPPNRAPREQLNCPYARAVFPTLDDQDKAKEVISKHWDSVVGANVK